MYLDIETTGLSPTRNQITTIVWWSAAQGWEHWIAGRHSSQQFCEAWQASSELITYNGKRFDEPFLIEYFGVEKHPGHIDLCQVGRKQGLRGGLKKICENLQIRSPAYLNEASGRDAVFLWRRYQREGNPLWLNRLLHYNAWDVVMTYRLHQILQNEPIEAIEQTMPFERV